MPLVTENLFADGITDNNSAHIRVIYYFKNLLLIIFITANMDLNLGILF